MAKFKHNKKRNSAFLYEILIKELTKSVLSQNKELQNKIMALVKESFSTNSMLYRELKICGIFLEISIIIWASVDSKNNYSTENYF